MPTLAFNNDYVSLEEITPMLRQHIELRAERPNVVLRMRGGDFQASRN